MNPILKWAGGKRRMLEQYAPLIPGPITGTYFEPFFGGGALYFHLEPDKAQIGDLNQQLMVCYRQIQENAPAVAAHLEDFASDYTLANDAQRKDMYYRIRRLFNTLTGDSAQIAAMMLFLNKTCFNGLWRVNKKGEFNVSFGRYKKPSFPSRAELIRAAAVLHTTTIRSGTYGWVKDEAKPGDFVYLDPPYIVMTDNFTSYTSDGFGLEDHVRLNSFISDLTSKGVYVMLSNSHTTHTRDIYHGLEAHTVYARRSINRDGNGRQPIPELVLTNYHRAKSRG